MTVSQPEVFGSPVQQGVERRAADIWQLLQHDPRFSCHGRAVAVTGDAETLDCQIALARLQGVGPADGVSASALNYRREKLQAAGLETDEYVVWNGEASAVDAARDCIATRQLRDDLSIVQLDAETPADMMARLDALTQSCDVLLPSGAFIRGVARPAACLVAQDRQGRLVGAAAAVAHRHPDSTDAGRVWWGMLSTDPDRRGEGIAMILGAHALVQMAEQHGFHAFTTGVREGNAPSEGLCRKLGFAPTDLRDLIAIYPPAFADGKLTK